MPISASGAGTGGNPFTDPQMIPGLYADRVRVQRRSHALLTAKIAGAHVGTRIADLLDPTSPLSAASGRAGRVPAVIADVGCGSGRPTRALAERFPHARLIAVDASATMLHTARQHLAETALAGTVLAQITYLRADFHHLPLAAGSCDAITAVFSLYHAADPGWVLAEITRCLHPDGRAVQVTKSADSYRELDRLVAAIGLDSDAMHRPSLYGTADSTRLPALVAEAIGETRNVEVLHDRHVFRFRDAAHIADYLATIPKYRLPPSLMGAPATLAAHLRSCRGDGPITTSSTITYVTICPQRQAGGSP